MHTPAPHPAPIPALTLPRTLFAVGAIRALPGELENLNVRKPLVVTDQGLIAAGVAATVVMACGDAATAVVFDHVTENPLYADVDAGAATYRAHACDGVIAVGASMSSDRGMTTPP